MRKISVHVDKQGFLFNPTNCAELATESSLAGFISPQSSTGSSQELRTPFQVNNCGALAFKPSFKAATSAKASKANGAALETTIKQSAGQANIKSVLVQLPARLPSRLTTLQKACPEATFAANPLGCPAVSRVGTASASTPLLPSKLTGPAFLVTHAQAAFPDLDLVLDANGVRSILEGKFPQRIVEKAVERMLPRGPLGRVQLGNLRVYAGPDHPHAAQTPEMLDVAGMNRKNTRSA